MRFLMTLCVVTVIAMAAGCGGGGGRAPAPVVDPNASPFTGTWKMIDAEGTLNIASDGKVTFVTVDDYSKSVTLTGSITSAGALNVKGSDSRGVGVSVWAALRKDHYGLHTEKLYVSFDDDNGTIHVLNDVDFEKV